MSNMSYCRFHNTNLDLLDCITALDDMSYNGGLDEYDKPLSDNEEHYARRLYENAQSYIETYEAYLEAKENSKE